MVYEVVVPLAGFEKENKFALEKIDDFFSMIKSEPNGIEIRVISFDSIKNVEFEIRAEDAKKLELKENSSYSVFYIFVLQNPVKKSIVNMIAPLIFNHDSKKMAQIQLDMDSLGLESLENLLPNI